MKMKQNNNSESSLPRWQYYLLLCLLGIRLVGSMVMPIDIVILSVTSVAIFFIIRNVIRGYYLATIYGLYEMLVSGYIITVSDKLPLATGTGGPSITTYFFAFLSASLITYLASKQLDGPYWKYINTTAFWGGCIMLGLYLEALLSL